MVVKAKVGRKRYIAFEILSGGEGLTRGKLVKAICSRADELEFRNRPDVILIEGGRGIVRTDQRNQRDAVALLNSFSAGSSGLRLQTIRASGTIRTLKESFFPRQVRNPRSP